MSPQNVLTIHILNTVAMKLIRSTIILATVVSLVSTTKLSSLPTLDGCENDQINFTNKSILVVVNSTERGSTGCTIDLSINTRHGYSQTFKVLNASKSSAYSYFFVERLTSNNCQKKYHFD